MKGTLTPDMSAASSPDGPFHLPLVRPFLQVLAPIGSLAAAYADRSSPAAFARP
jgi:hypothetical protein